MTKRTPAQIVPPGCAVVCCNSRVARLFAPGWSNGFCAGSAIATTDKIHARKYLDIVYNVPNNPPKCEAIWKLLVGNKRLNTFPKYQGIRIV